MVDLEHHTLVEKVWESSRTTIYKGYRREDQRPVMVKVPRGDYPGAREIAKIEHEYQILSRLDHRGVVKALGLERLHRGVALVLEDFGGQPLSSLIDEGSLDVKTALAIALSLADTLDALHRHQVLHKDIKPHNIVCNLRTGETKLIDFGIATRLGREVQRLVRPDALEGTLAYMSPEQTGRMNRDIDYRSDLYSLGVTLYEMLARALPFESRDAVELVHHHIARVPAPPHERAPGVPEAVSRIAMKLLSKEAEDRYQHARGLAADLEACLDQLSANGDIEAFALGQRDFSDVLHIPQRLYGREAEASALLAAFDAAGEGRSRLLLVAGAAGVGKSALVHEVHKAIARRGGDFIAGKFDQLHRGVPFASFTQAFRDLVRQLLTEPPAALAAWRAKLVSAVGVSGRVLTDLLPELEAVIGAQPEVASLGPTEAQNRFGMVFQRFVRAFCSASHPLVLFLDDLQWADPASLWLLKLLLSDPEGAHLLVIGAYRDHEVDDAHPLRGVLQELRRDGVEPIELTLAPLDQASVLRLAGDTLGGAGGAHLQALAEQLFAKTHGNPFFLTQLLLAWYREGLLSVDRTTGRWTWKDESVARAPVADNVVEFMIGRLKTLDPRTQRLLSLAACVGHQFDRATLSTIAERAPREVATELWPALKEGLLVPLDTDYRLVFPAPQGDGPEGGDFDVAYRFLHDRVQQAAYALIEADQKQDVHLRIGRRLRETLTDRSGAEALFEVVDHLNAGAARIDAPGERADLARLNLTAGRTAKAATAYAAALGFFNAGLAMLDAASFGEDHDLAFALSLEQAECVYLSGQFDQVDPLVEALLAQARTNRERVAVYGLRMTLYTSQGRFADGLGVGRAALALFGVELPEDGALYDAAFDAEVAEIDRHLAARPLESLIDAPPLTDPDQQAVLQILARMDPLSYATDPRLCGIVTAKQFNILLSHGCTRLSGSLCSSFSLFMAGRLGRFADTVRLAQLALRFVDKHNASEFECKVNFNAGYTTAHGEPMTRSLAYFERAVQTGFAFGDLFYGSVSVYWLAATRLRMGRPLDAMREEIDRGIVVLQRTKDVLAMALMMGLHQVVAALEGRSDEVALSAEVFDLHKDTWRSFLDVTGLRVVGVYYYLCKLQLAVLFDDHDTALTMVEGAERMQGAATGCHWMTDLPFYGGLALAAAYPAAAPEQQEALLLRLARYRAALAELCDGCPENERHRKALVDAEAARIAGDQVRAMALYDQAIALARDGAFPHHEALANELCARFHLAHGRRKIAAAYLIEARYGYERWGAVAKVKQLDGRYAELLGRADGGGRGAAAGQKLVTNTTTSTSGTFALDVPSMIKASQALSGEISFDKLIVRMMSVVAENAGAEKGALIVKTDDELRVEAEMSLSEGVSVCREPVPVDGAAGIVTGIVQYVARTQETVVLADAANESTFAKDPDVSRRRPKSVLCMPLLHQGQLKGVLYLENNLTAGTFTEERTKLLGVLCSQMAISIENAYVYANLERLVAQRTQELREAQARLVKLEKQATEVRMAGGFAHEMRNSLASAKLLLESVYKIRSGEVQSLCDDTGRHLEALLEASRELVPEAAMPRIIGPIRATYRNESDILDVLGGMHRHIERSLKVTHLILDYARIGFESPGTTPVAVPVLVDAIVREGGRELAQHRIAVAVEAEPDCVVLGNENHFYSILKNLIANARDALIEVGDDRERAIRVRIARRAEGGVVLQVADNGAGIAPEDRTKVFEPFFSTKPSSGTGLGLGIVEKLVSLYGGAIDIESEPVRGTTVSLHLPAHAG